MTDSYQELVRKRRELTISKNKKFKRGGKVEGDKARSRLDKMARGGAKDDRDIETERLGKREDNERTDWDYAKGGKVKKWIGEATKNKGGLHRALDVPEGEKIPEKKLAKAAHSASPKVRKEVSLAKTLKKMH